MPAVATTAPTAKVTMVFKRVIRLPPLLPAGPIARRTNIEHVIVQHRKPARMGRHGDHLDPSVFEKEMPTCPARGSADPTREAYRPIRRFAPSPCKQKVRIRDCKR